MTISLRAQERYLQRQFRTPQLDTRILHSRRVPENLLSRGFELEVLQEDEEHSLCMAYEDS